MQINQSLQDAAQAMQTAAENGRAVAPLLKKLCPHIHRQIVKDGKQPVLLARWGQSVNFDENAGQIIVHPAILQVIGELAGVPMRGQFVHAGLQHTYGYLFSMIQTPYGTKRERWVSEEWELGFGLERSLLGPEPQAGTLLANLTWFTGQIVYRKQPRLLDLLGEMAGSVAAELVQYDFSRLAVFRLTEEIVLPGNPRRLAQLLTDLVPFPRRPADRQVENTVLIYSIQNGARAAPRLITAFPIRQQAARELKASASPDAPVELSLRYNAYLAGLRGRTVLGRRYLSEE